MLFPSQHRSYKRNIKHLFGGYVPLYIVLGFVVFLILVTTVLPSKFNMSSIAIKKWTTNISTKTFVSALSVEIPRFNTYIQSSEIETPKYSSIFLEMITSFNPTDPRTLIKNEIPGFSFFDGELVIAGQGVDYTDIPPESSPPLEVIIAEREVEIDALPEKEDNATPEPNQEPTLTTEGRKVIFIYHSHNRESWLPHLTSESDPDRAYHPEMNITKVGMRLGEELEKRGIGTTVDTTDVTEKLHEAEWSYNQSYQASKLIVETALAKNNDITFVFDIHRDSFRQERTTVEINGKSFARPFFVIGGRNNDYEKNVQLAEQFHDMLEEAYPGLSRGVIVKNSMYNQSLSANRDWWSG